MTKQHLSVRVAVATALLLSGACAFAQQYAGSPDSTMTVVTLYSKRAAGAQTASDSQPPIRIVDGGVKSAGNSCWKLSDSGQVTAQPGECYVLRSAEPGETPAFQ